MVMLTIVRSVSQIHATLLSTCLSASMCFNVILNWEEGNFSLSWFPALKWKLHYMLIKEIVTQMKISHSAETFVMVTSKTHI